MDCPASTSPYVPNLRKFSKAGGAKQVLNSVGLSGLLELSGRERLHLLRTLATAHAVSVREEASSQVLKRFGIPHLLAPDLVHTLSLTRPVASQPDPPVLVQASAQYLSEVGTEAFAAAISDSRALAPFEIQLFAAGTARFHDDVEVYAQVIEQVRRRSPGRRIKLSTAQRPLEKADQIAACAAWIGTSLHGRVVSASYDRPRIGLANAKVTSYARTWDSAMPFGVALEELDSALEAALSPALGAASLPTSAELRRLADENIRTILAKVDSPERRSRATRVARTARTFTAFTIDYSRRNLAR